LTVNLGIPRGIGLDTRAKIVGLPVLKRKVAAIRRKGTKIAFTNGCFDILHAGHIRYLETAKKNDRILIVGLNSDNSIRRIKGPGRPINPQQRRAEVLGALACVDYVTIFHEDTPYRLIAGLQPDVLIKGADWKGREVVGADIVRAQGGRVELIRYLPQFSTTKVLKKIQRRG